MTLNSRAILEMKSDISDMKNNMKNEFAAVNERLKTLETKRYDIINVI